MAKNIEDLRQLTARKTWLLIKISLVILTITSFSACLYFGTPWLMAIFVGAIFLIPLFGHGKIKRSFHHALEAYEGHHSSGAMAVWRDEGSEGHDWWADIDLGDEGRWSLHIGGAENPVPKNKLHLPANITVWFHPETKEPRLIRTEKGLFPAFKVTANA